MIATQVQHELHECDMSETQATQKQHKCDTSAERHECDTSATHTIRVRHE